MLNRFVSAVFVFVLALNFSSVAFANTPSPNRLSNVNKAKAAQLISQLPESDAVASIDAKRLLESGLPGLLAGNPTLLKSIMDTTDELQKSTGIDLKSFDMLVAGVKSVKVKEGEFDFHPVIIARGNVNSSDLVQQAKKAANNKYKEESIGDRSFIIFKTEDLAEQLGNTVNVSEKDAGMVDKAITKISGEMALMAIDRDTIAFGEPSRIRQTIEGKTKVSTEIRNLLSRTHYSMASFAAVVPHGMSSILPLDDDDLGQSIDTIKQLFGSMDVNESGAVFNLTMKTAQNSQAVTLHETIDGMKSIGAAILGGSARDDQKLYAKAINALKVSRKGNEIAFDLMLPQADVNALTALIK